MAEQAQNQSPSDEGEYAEESAGAHASFGVPDEGSLPDSSGAGSREIASESVSPVDSEGDSDEDEEAPSESADRALSGIGSSSPEEAPEGEKRWYVLKVQSNREDSIRESLERRVAIEGMQPSFGEIIVPTEKVSEIKGGKRRVSERKLYPGYIMIQMVMNDDTWFLVRETPGVGDFTGASGQLPMPMLDHEVERMLGRETAKGESQPRLKIDFHPGDTVKIKEGTFENFEGSVDSVDEANGRVTVMINIFGRSCPVELEYWQVETV